MLLDPSTGRITSRNRRRGRTAERCAPAQGPCDRAHPRPNILLWMSVDQKPLIAYYLRIGLSQGVLTACDDAIKRRGNDVYFSFWRVVALSRDGEYDRKKQQRWNDDNMLLQSESLLRNLLNRLHLPRKVWIRFEALQKAELHLLPTMTNAFLICSPISQAIMLQPSEIVKHYVEREIQTIPPSSA